MTGGSMVVTEQVKGTRENIECSNRGICDGSTGRCECATQYGSSDGQGNTGRLGECGHLHALEGTNGRYSPYPVSTAD